jgi:predicted nucleic acid-binding protein
MAYVVDASVGLKWFLPEELTSNAERLLAEKQELLVPDLFFVEIGNALWKRVQRGLMPPEEAQRIAETVPRFPLNSHPSRDLAEAALAIAINTGRTVYDSLYVALAVREEAPLVTADERLYNAISSGPLAPRVAWVGDL